LSFESINLVSASAGTQTSIKFHRFGPTGGKKVYIQAGLHADEHPGLLVAQHLIAQLIQLEAAQALQAEIIVVPFANPTGLRQRIFGLVAGRCDWHTGRNFNRAMAVDSSELLTSIANQLSNNEHNNSSLLRAALINTINSRNSLLEIDQIHKALLSLSIDAHCVLDLHCDVIALPHLFYGTHQREQGQSLARCLGYDICLEEDVTGTVAFDGTHTQPWVTAQNHFKDKPFADPCFAATIELRGHADVSQKLAKQDSQGILNFLTEQQYLTFNQDNEHPTSQQQIHGVDQIRLIQAPCSGIVTYATDLGANLNKGDLIAEVVLLDKTSPERIAVTAPCSGRLFSQTDLYFTTPGQTIGMIATNEQQIAPGSQLAF